ncbi:MATE family efflux transporter [Photobacterium phosphoreum]|jgi:putative MATE family efflux protein|uniref:MATE family efflux transporter n=1 Tax=Photobacterium phosphoreum TaxID=659 RepID=UPI0005E93B6C|nr:MATE family efflux transporter [Photobacterium phosphoreum]KJF86107.1 multidrug transporter [Photobacterium phosphoreum]MCD9469022.1 multidrug efflux protein [Photobacterium phosphoreum]MCD9477525.1 MATE family efflux transporter [Photobacterium phosphoreum]MCD9505774.1 MATE family efflux transporter [Photobacterium phosphoreum]OBU39349.1 MATE family efflux transporter [Photobacterium phosphoreum]
MPLTHSPPTLTINQNFWRYAIPSIAAMLVTGLYQIVDGIFVGHYVGYQGLAAINMAWPITYLLSGLGLMIGIGSGTLISIARGEKNPHHAQRALDHAVLLITVISVMALVLFVHFGETLLTIQGANHTIKALALQYVQSFGWAAFVTIFAGAIPMLIRNDDSPKIATGLLIAGALTNIVLDYLFIGIFKWQLQGAAIATIIAQSITVVGGIIYFCSAYSPLRIRLTIVNIQFSHCWKIMSLGSSVLIMYLYASFVVALHNYQFMQYGTELTVSAFAIVGYMMTLYYLVAEGIAEGMQPPVSYYYGAKQPQNISKTTFLAIKVTIIAGISWFALLYSFPHTLIGLFNSGNAALTSEAVSGIQLHLFAMFLDGLIVLATVYFMSVDKAGKALTISISNMLVQLPFLYFLPQWLGVNGVWLSMPLSTILLSIIVLPMVWHDLQQRNKVTPSMPQPAL